MSDIALRILTRQKVVLNARVTSVIVPGTEGDFEVLGNHTPLVTVLRPGRIVATCNGERKNIEVAGGFVMVTPDRVDILAERADLTPR